MNFAQIPETNFFIYAAVFLGILLTFEGLRNFMSRAEDNDTAVNRRMRLIQSGGTQDQLLAQLLDANASTKGTSLTAKLAKLLSQSGLPLSVGKFLIIAGLFSVLIGSLAVPFLALHFAVLVALMAGLVIPIAVISMIRKKRLEKLTKQLPDALDLMSRGLEVGHPLSVTVGNVASDMPDPIGSEFGLIQDQVNYGDDISTAFADFANRVDLEDVRYTSVSVSIQHGTGGNLAHVLRVLSKVIRDRSMMRKKIHAISAEGRLSAVILSALPFLIITVISVTSPTFYGDVIDDPLMLYFGSAVLVLIALQALILMRMVNFKF